MSGYRDKETGQPLTEAELYERYDDALDGDDDDQLIRIGTLTYTASRVLKAVDPIAYRVGFNDWVDGELGETIEETD